MMNKTTNLGGYLKLIKDLLYPTKESLDILEIIDLSSEEIYERVDKMISTLPEERQQRIIRTRYALNGEKKTLKALGEEYGLTPEPIRQAQSKAVRLLRHPKRLNILFNKEVD